MQTGTETIVSWGQRIAGRLAGCSSVFAPVLSQQDANQVTDAKAPSAPWCLPVPAGSRQGGSAGAGCQGSLSPGLQIRPGLSAAFFQCFYTALMDFNRNVHIQRAPLSPSFSLAAIKDKKPFRIILPGLLPLPEKKQSARFSVGFWGVSF